MKKPHTPIEMSVADLTVSIYQAFWPQVTAAAKQGKPIIRPGEDLSPVAMALQGTGKTEDKLPPLSYKMPSEFAAFVHKSNKIPAPDILAALEQMTKPFTRLWIEVDTMDLLPLWVNPHPEARTRTGFLCQQSDFSALSIYKVQTKTFFENNLPGKEIPVTCFYSRIQDGKIIQDDTVLDYLTKDDGHADTSYAAFINGEHDATLFIARTLVILSSPLVSNNVWQPRTADDIAQLQRQYFLNMSRKSAGKPQIFRVRPLVVDMTALPSGDKKPVRSLSHLGLTEINVRPSRAWINRKTNQLRLNKDGQPITTRAYKRRARVSCGYQQGMRELTASAPAELELRPDHPVMRVTPLKPGEPKNS